MSYKTAQHKTVKTTNNGVQTDESYHVIKLLGEVRQTIVMIEAVVVVVLAIIVIVVVVVVAVVVGSSISSSGR